MDNKVTGSISKKQIFTMPFNSNYVILWLMLCIYPFIVIPNSDDYFYLPRYIILAVLAIISLPLIFRNKEKLYRASFIPLLFFLTFAIISAINSMHPETAWMGLFGAKIITTQDNTNVIITSYRLTGISTYIFCIILFILAFQSDKSEKIIKYMIISAAIVSIIALLQHFGVNFVPHEEFRNYEPPYGTIGQHNFLATYTVFILPAAMFYYLKYKEKLYLLCSGLIYGGLLVSRTRGAWIAFGITFVIYIFYIFKRKDYHKTFIIVSAVLFLITCILLPSQGGVLLGRLSSIPSNISSGLQLDDSAGSFRLYIWKQVFSLLPKYWAFGMGPDNLIYAGIAFGSNLIDKAHNIYLEMAVTMGVFTLTSYLIFISYFFRRWKNDTGFMFFIMILTYMIQGFFNIDVIMVLPIFWIILGFSMRNSIMLDNDTI